jgi:hypothetical protein
MCLVLLDNPDSTYIKLKALHLATSIIKWRKKWDFGGIVNKS